MWFADGAAWGREGRGGQRGVSKKVLCLLRNVASQWREDPVYMGQGGI